MAAKKKPEEVKPGAPEYMNTYGDMITLMLCFFVLLFAFSTVDAKKFEEIASALSGSPIATASGGKDSIKDMLGSGIMQFPSITPNKKPPGGQNADTTKYESAQQELQQMTSDFKTYFAENEVSDMIAVEQNDQEVTITFPEGVLFDRGRADLKEEAFPILDVVANKLMEYPDNDIMIEGHADSDPIHTPQYPSNFHLSAARAISVEVYFVEDKGFNPALISAIGRGEYVPVVPNDTLENKAKNRRVEIKVKSLEYSGSSDEEQ